jgi:SAM-dependent methyltransferase
MRFEKPEDFYAVYDRHRTYVRAEVRKKHLAEFGRNLWVPGEFAPKQRVLELGCGVGLFLAYLQRMGAGETVGVEMDAKALDYMPPEIAASVHTTTFEDFLNGYRGPAFDRIVLLDVFEHFSPGEGVALLERLKAILTDAGRIVLRVPNLASPWGLQFQYNDLSHKAGYGPGNLRQLGLAAGLDCTYVGGYTRGSRGRRFTTRLVEGLLNRLLTDPPPVWSANFVAVFKKTV